MQRGLLDTLYVLTGETAQCLREYRGLDTPSIDCVLERRFITPEVMSMLRDWIKGEVTDEGFTYEFNGVPVRCKFIENKYDYFSYADSRYYNGESFRIPNKFDEYWKEKDKIK